MSYYYQHNFSFSYHGLTRIKQRLKLTNVDEYQLKDAIIEMIDNSTEYIETRYHFYIKLDDYKMYAVVDKPTKLIITVTPISPAKMLEILNYE